MMMDVRVRFSPSPTGTLHVGTARTALFNWLFGRHHGGTFILRIEDTDPERSDPRFEAAIVEDLAWLGLAWDEGPEAGGDYGPYRQSERAPAHRAAAERLLAGGKVYLCYCTPQELERERERALAEGRMPKYSGRCRKLDESEANRMAAEGRKPTVRFKVETGLTVVHDLVRGDIEFDHAVVGDFVLVRSNGAVSYNFAVTLDDAAMKITHVIRGEDHLTNTVRQLMLYEALGIEAPAFAHLPMIVGRDGAKLSKRHGATGIGELREAGYLAETLTNYMSLLGWLHPEAKEIFSLEEATRVFELVRVSKSPAIFDREKLDWMNGKYLREMPPQRLQRIVLSFAAEDEAIRRLEARGTIGEFVEATRESAKTLADFPSCARIYTNSVGIREEGARAELGTANAVEVIAAARSAIGQVEKLDAGEARRVLDELRAVMEPRGVSGRALFMPLRAALTGTTHGPELYRVLSILGKDEALRRLAEAPVQGTEDA